MRWGSGGTNHNLLYWIGEQYDLISILKSNSSHSPEGGRSGQVKTSGEEMQAAGPEVALQR